MRINRFLAVAGLGSRRQVERLVLNKEISINNQVVENLSTDVKDDDIVRYKGKIIKSKHKLYFALYKPKGYISTTGDKFADKIVTDLIPSKERLFVVGRLDKDSEGLMILTNDGEFAQKMTHPRYEHEKEYEVIISHKDTDSLKKTLRYFRSGVNIDGYKTKPATVNVLDERDRTAKLKIILKEGRKRQIRITVEKAGARVIKLLRTRIGNVELGDLSPGQWKPFSPQLPADDEKPLGHFE